LSTADSLRSAFPRHNHDRRHAFADVPMRDANDRGLDHAGDRVDLGLDLLRVGDGAPS
jgi:hypothetical protein